MCSAKLWTRDPTRYTLSSALSYHAKLISNIRSRISGKTFDEETYFEVVCAMQTEVCMPFAEKPSGMR